MLLFSRMTNEFTAIFKKSGEWYLGWVEELPGANAQERTLDAARESLRAAVVDILAANRELSESAAESDGPIR